jgi:hypothetical protein
MQPHYGCHKKSLEGGLMVHNVLSRVVDRRTEAVESNDSLTNGAGMRLQQRRVSAALIPGLRRTALGVISVASISILGLVGGAASASAAPTPASCSTPTPVTALPTNPFGANVTIFNASESVSTINAALSAPYTSANQEFFFLPGTYGSASATPATATTSNTIDAQVASGSVVAGLGASPCDVVINGNLGIYNDSLAIRPSQLENLTINPIESGDPADTMTWSTSQEATWRRVNLLGNLLEAALPYTAGLCLDACAPFPGSGINASGAVENGFEVANSNITGDVIDTNGQNTAGVSGRDGNSDPYIQGSNIGGAQGFGTDTMFAGDAGNVPATNFGPAVGSKPAGSNINVKSLPVVRESPFVYYRNGQFYVFDPSVQFDRRGYDWSLNGGGKSLPLGDFYLANASTDTAATINAALSGGKDVLLEPGAYSVTAPLTVPHANQVIFGLGEASVTASTNTPTIVVDDAATGTILAGFQANGLGFNATTNTGPYAADQIEIGTKPKATGSPLDPTSLSDVSTVSNSTTDELINQNDVLLNQAEIQSNNNSGSGYTTVNWPAESSGDYGIVVNGDDVTLEGIWLEHFKMTEATWNGNGGQVIFLENELPLTIPYSAAGVQPSFWKESSSFDGYPSLAVSPSVTSFTLTGMQSWSRFGSGCDCLVTSLITAPVKRDVSINDIFSGQILGSASLSGGATAVGPGFPDFSGSTQGGVLNLINTDGVSSYIPYNPAMTASFVATTNSGSETVTNVSSFTGITVGSVITAPDITFDTTVTAINTNADTLTLSAAPTGSGNVGEAITASGPGYNSFAGTTNGTTTVTLTPGVPPFFEGLAVGSTVSAPDITGGQTVTGINTTAGTITLSAPASGSTTSEAIVSNGPGYNPTLAWIGSSAYPHSDLYGHGVTNRIVHFPSWGVSHFPTWHWRHHGWMVPARFR